MAPLSSENQERYKSRRIYISYNHRPEWRLIDIYITECIKTESSLLFGMFQLPDIISFTTLATSARSAGLPSRPPPGEKRSLRMPPRSAFFSSFCNREIVSETACLISSILTVCTRPAYSCRTSICSSSFSFRSNRFAARNC